MDPLDFLEADQLLQFFRRNKTELSCMQSPRVFLNQLRDHNLIPEDRYKKMIRMKSKDNRVQALYDFLDWLESKQSQHIKAFWMCVFKDPIMNVYPTLRMLRTSLMDGSFQFGTQLPEKVEIEDTGKVNGQQLSENEEKDKKEANSVKKKRKLRSSSTVEEEQPSTSTPSTPVKRRKSKKIYFSSPLQKGEKNDIWTWPMYQNDLPVTCGKVEGTLKRDKMAKGEMCIVHQKQWFTPNEFQTFAGMQGHKNWKTSIRCRGTTMQKLIQEGHLKSTQFKGGRKKKSPPTTDDSVSEKENEDENEESDPDKEDQAASSSRGSATDFTVEEEEEMERPAEQQREVSHDSSKTVFKVTCGTIAGTLHVKRFVSGNRGKSIRTEMSWMTPIEFMETASCGRDASWRKDITYEGKPLSVLLEASILRIHSLLCTCPTCKQDSQALEDQKNDDECFICRRSEQEPFVVCDGCPCSFHQNCHLPHIEDAIIGDGSLWMCSFCVYRNTQGCYYRDELKKEAAMSRQISQHMLECQYLLLRLWSSDEEQTFATNPSLYLQDYSTAIETPMWLGNIADKLQGQLYQTVGEFVSDVQLIFTNCAAYNQENAEFLAMGARLRKLFDRELKNVFNICE